MQEACHPINTLQNKHRLEGGEYPEKHVGCRRAKHAGSPHAFLEKDRTQRELRRRADGVALDQVHRADHRQLLGGFEVLAVKSDGFFQGADRLGI
jgi:hypothetical protein